MSKNPFGQDIPDFRCTVVRRTCMNLLAKYRGGTSNLWAVCPSSTQFRDSISTQLTLADTCCQADCQSWLQPSRAVDYKRDSWNRNTTSLFGSRAFLLFNCDYFFIHTDILNLNRAKYQSYYVPRQGFWRQYFKQYTDDTNAYSNLGFTSTVDWNWPLCKQHPHIFSSRIARLTLPLGTPRWY